MSDYVQVMTTTDDADHADVLAAAILDARTAACVQVVGPIRSHYRWKGEIEHTEEWSLVIKTTAERLDALIATIAAHHHYDVPEITATPIVGGSPAYLDWITASVA